MRYALLSLLLMSCSLLVSGQTPKYPPLDKSPMDMSYYPANYPILKLQKKTIEPLVARIIYGRPQKNGRTVFGELREYGKLWRLGANEATEIEFFKDVKIAGKKVKKGRYTMYAIPYPDKWTIIINKDTDMWGDFIYDSTKDVLRTTVNVQKLPEPLEAFTMVFEKVNDNTFNLEMAWDDIKAVLPISL
jgi:hypothetical protein